MQCFISYPQSVITARCFRSVVFRTQSNPKLQHDCGWWNSAMCYRKKKKKKAKLRQSSSLVCGYYPSGRWPQPCARPRWTHAVGFLSSPRLYVRAGSSSRAAPIYIASLQSVAWGKHVRKTNLCSVSYATTGQLFLFFPKLLLLPVL